MKKFISSILLITFLTTHLGFAALTMPPTNNEKQYLGENLITNPGAELNLSGWCKFEDTAGATPTAPDCATSSLAEITLTRDTSSDKLSGNASFKISKPASNEQGEGIKIASITIPKALNTPTPKLVQFSFRYNYSANFVTGASSDMIAFVYDDVNSVYIPITEAYLDGTGTYRGEFYTKSDSTSYSVGLFIATTSALAYDVWIDDVEWREKPSNEKTSQYQTAWVAYTPTTTGIGTPTISAKWRRNGHNLEVFGNATIGTSSANTVSIGFPAGLSIDTNIVTSNLTESLGLFTRAGSTTLAFPVGGLGSWIMTAQPSVSTTALYVATQTDRATNIFVLQNGNAIFNANSDKFTFNFSVPISGWEGGLPQTAEQVDWRVDANISGANPALGTAAVSSYTEITNGSLTLTNNTSKGSISNVFIPCSTTNDSSGTTCSAGNESLGVAFTPPKSGYVKACASFTWFGEIGAASSVQSVFQIIKTPNNAQTISVEGSEKIPSAQTGSNNTGFSTNKVCGRFWVEQGIKQTLRLMYEQSVGGTVIQSSIYGDANTSNGQRDIHFSVEPEVNYGNLLIANTPMQQVSSGSINKIRVCNFNVDSAAGAVTEFSGQDCVNGSCAITNTSTFTCTWNTGIWATGSTVFCDPKVIDAGATAAIRYAQLNTSTTSSVAYTTQSQSGATSALNKYSSTVECKGIAP